MQSLEIIEKELQPNIKHIKFIGALDSSEQEAVLNLEQKIKNYKPNLKLIFDFEELTYLNSFAIGFIAHWFNMLKTQNTQIVLLNPQTQVFDVLNVLGLTQVLKIVHSLDEAIKAE